MSERKDCNFKILSPKYKAVFVLQIMELLKKILQEYKIIMHINFSNYIFFSSDAKFLEAQAHTSLSAFAHYYQA